MGKTGRGVCISGIEGYMKRQGEGLFCFEGKDGEKRGEVFVVRKFWGDGSALWGAR